MLLPPALPTLARESTGPTAGISPTLLTDGTALELKPGVRTSVLLDSPLFQRAGLAPARDKLADGMFLWLVGWPAQEQ